MTRETKAGLVVTGSFLCLVGVVVVSKLREKDTGPAPYTRADGTTVEVPEDPAPAKEEGAPATPPTEPVSGLPPLQTPPSEGPASIQRTGATTESPATGPSPAAPAAPGSNGKGVSAEGGAGVSNEAKPAAKPEPEKKSGAADSAAVMAPREATPSSSTNLENKTGQALPADAASSNEMKPAVKPEPNQKTSPGATVIETDEETGPGPVTQPGAQAETATAAPTPTNPGTSAGPGSKGPAAPPGKGAGYASVSGPAAGNHGVELDEPPPVPGRHLRNPFALPEPARPVPGSGPSPTPSASPAGLSTQGNTPEKGTAAGPPATKPDSASIPAKTAAAVASPASMGPSAPVQASRPAPILDSARTGSVPGPGPASSPSPTLTPPPGGTPASLTPSGFAPGVNLLRPIVPEPVRAADPGQSPGVMPVRPQASPQAADDAPPPSSHPTVSRDGRGQSDGAGSPGISLPPATQLAQGPSPPATGVFPSRTEPARSIPPLGTPATATSPPVPVPVPPSGSSPVAPQVDSYDEEMYYCKPDDSLEKISLQFYHTEKYARALVLFNRNHYGVGDGVRREPPVLQAGQPLFIPPLRVLESKYAAAIPDHKPLPPASSLPAVPVGLAPPRGPGDPPQAVAPAANWSSPSGERLYKVRAKGEMLFEIARRTLGNGERWWEIYRLNTRFNPKDPVPAGVVLHLPPDAHVEPEDQPKDGER